MSIDERAGLAAAVDRVAAEHGFSGVVQVAVGEEPAFERAYGLADRARGIPNTVDTRFGTASATKFLTALGIGVLVDDGALTPDSRLVDVVRAPLPGMDPQVTIGQLLSHTSGVYDYYDEDVITDFDNFELPIPPAALQRPSDYLPMLTGPQKFPPGTAFSYSNGGYVLLGLVIEELTGSFHGHLERRVLAPGGMRRSGFFRLDRLPPDTAIGYCDQPAAGRDDGPDAGRDDGPDAGRDDGDGPNAGVERTNAGMLPVVGGPDGGMYATVGDLRSLWRHFVAGDIVSPALVRRFGTAVSRTKHGRGYGCGLWIRDPDGRSPARFVEGCDAGVSIRSTLYEPMTVVTVVSNSTDGAWPVVQAMNELMG